MILFHLDRPTTSWVGTALHGALQLHLFSGAVRSQRLELSLREMHPEFRAAMRATRARASVESDPTDQRKLLCSGLTARTRLRLYPLAACLSFLVVSCRSFAARWT